MRFLIDESADARLVGHLTSLGHDAIFVAHSHGPGIDDRDVLAIARAGGRILITDDPDFGALVVRGQEPHAGVIFFRLRTTAIEARIERLDDVLKRYSDRLDSFLVVTERRIRVRHATEEPGAVAGSS